MTAQRPLCCVYTGLYSPCSKYPLGLLVFSAYAYRPTPVDCNGFSSIQTTQIITESFSSTGRVIGQVCVRVCVCVCVCVCVDIFSALPVAFVQFTFGKNIFSL